MSDGVAIAGLHDELDRSTPGLREPDGVLEHIFIVRDPIHGQNLPPFGQLGFERRTVPEDFADLALGVLVIETQTDRVQQAHALALLVAGLLELAGLVGVDESIAASLEA